jgi:uncharacterized membrane protein
MKWFSKYAGAAVLVIFTLVVLISLLVVFLPSPTPEERAAFERWQAEQVSRASETGGEKKE